MLLKRRLERLLDYDCTTGVFRWRVTRSPGAKRGSVAGRLNAKGYLIIGVDGNRYMAHRLAWFYVYGVWPESELDHVNGNRSDNRVRNLRQCSRSENLQNACTRRDSQSGVKGVRWHQSKQRWQPRVKHQGKQLYLGYYRDMEFADLVAREARDKYHGEYARNQ